MSNGLFSVLLGNTAMDGMTEVLAADVFSQPGRYLRVWFGTSSGGSFDQLKVVKGFRDTQRLRRVQPNQAFK